MPSLILVVLWFAGTMLRGWTASEDRSGRRYALLVAIGVPILGLVTFQHGPWVGMLVLALGAGLLRWPLSPRHRARRVAEEESGL